MFRYLGRKGHLAIVWNGSSENLFSAEDKVSGYDTLLDLMLNRQPVEAKFGIPANANADGVPAAGLDPSGRILFR